ncbi:MAG TPA: urease accessory protein UreE [Burkholderiaceae bacterium]|nr:urease accessory protein UreE [Burkholderiaceae bacterium]
MPLRCTRLHDSTAPAPATHELHLVYAERVKSRLAAVCTDGTAVAILLPRGTVMRDGTLLAADDGAVVHVVAAAQAVTRISAPTPLMLLRAVYHLANRHVPACLAAEQVLIEPDPVLERLLQSLGARIEHLQIPFDPEPGAYHGGHSHGDPVHADPAATVGEQLSIEAHRERLAALAAESGAGHK